MLAPPAACLFDLDGLLLDTEPLHGRGWSEAAAHFGATLSKDQLLRALVRSNPRLNLEGARSAIAALHLVDDDGGAETISLPRMLEIHETLQATIALQEDSSVDNVLAMLEVMAGPAGITREQAAAALWEENGIIGRAVQRLQRQESGS